MAFQDDKDAILAIIRAKSCAAANYINKYATTYEKLLVDMVFEFSRTFDCDTTGYLESVCAIVDDAILTGMGVYYNKNVATIANPKLLVKCTVTDVNITASVVAVLVTAGCTVTNINLSNNAQVTQLIVGGASTVTKLDIAAGSCIEELLVKACNANISTLNKISYNGCVRSFGIDEGAVYNGFECPPTT